MKKNKKPKNDEDLLIAKSELDSQEILGSDD